MRQTGPGRTAQLTPEVGVQPLMLNTLNSGMVVMWWKLTDVEDTKVLEHLQESIRIQGCWVSRWSVFKSMRHCQAAVLVPIYTPTSPVSMFFLTSQSCQNLVMSDILIFPICYVWNVFQLEIPCWQVRLWVLNTLIWKKVILVRHVTYHCLNWPIPMASSRCVC